MVKKIAFIIFMILFCVACGSPSSNDEPKEKPVTKKQSEILSQVLFNNHEHKGARFEISSGKIPEGFHAKGVISWSDESFISIAVNLDTEEHNDIVAHITSDGVYEYLPLYGQDVSGIFDNSKFVLRPYDPTKYAVDALGQFLIKLASDAPDNPILLKQNGAMFLGTQEVHGDETFKYKISDSVTYFVDNSGDLRRVVANVKGFQYPIEVTLSGFGKQVGAGIPDNDIVPFEDVSEVYLSLRPAF